MLSKSDDDGAQGSRGLVIPWGALSLTLAVVAVSSLGVLATVVSIKNIDTLSVVALALAVLAFAAQLIVSLAQASGSAHQIAQTERVNADTQAALAEIRGTANSLLTNQRDLFGQVLRAALPEVARELSSEAAAVGESGQQLNSADIEDKLESVLTRVLNSVPGQSVITQSTDSWKVREERRLRARQYERMMSYPGEEEGRQYLEILNSLSPYAAQRFGDLGSTFRERLGRGLSGDLRITKTPVIGPAFVELIEKGLIEEVPNTEKVGSDGKATSVWKLTELGIGVSRITRAPADGVPEWVLDALSKRSNS